MEEQCGVEIEIIGTGSPKVEILKQKIIIYDLINLFKCVLNTV